MVVGVQAKDIGCNLDMDILKGGDFRRLEAQVAGISLTIDFSTILQCTIEAFRKMNEDEQRYA